MKSNRAFIALLIGALVCAPAVATDKYPIKPDLDKQNVDTFQAQMDGVHKEMDKGGRFEYIKDNDRATVEDGLKFMHDLIQQSGSVAAMKEDDKILLFNRQEKINTLLTNSDSQRIICEKAPQPGSLFRLTTCHTVAELARRTRDAQNTIEATQNRTMMNSFSAAAAGH
jgi:hypothetical protein